MGRTTNTRALVKETAEKLSHEGLAPEQITVDLVLGKIGQGSRTTINEELKLWRKERQIQVPAEVPVSLVPMVSSLWQAALAESANSYAQARKELTDQLSDAVEAREADRASLVSSQERVERQRQAIELLNAELEKQEKKFAARENELLREVAVKTSVIEGLEARNQVANERMVEMQRATMLRLAEQKADFELRLAEAQNLAAAYVAQAEQTIAEQKQKLAERDGMLTEVAKNAANLRVELAQSEANRNAVAEKNAVLELRMLELNDQLAAQATANQILISEKEKEIKSLLISEATAQAKVEELHRAQEKQQLYLNSLEARIEALIERATEARKEEQKGAEGQDSVVGEDRAEEIE